MHKNELYKLKVSKDLVVVTLCDNICDQYNGKIITLQIL